MKNVLVQYLWIITVTFVLLTLALEIAIHNKEDKLEYLLKEVEKVQEEQKVLTEKEKELVEKAFEKEWEEVDKQTDK